MTPATFYRSLGQLVADCSGIFTVRELLHRLVLAEIRHASERRLHRYAILQIPLEELEQSLGKGRAGSADLPALRKIDPDRAFEVVLDAFTDGLILLFIDERRCMHLDETVQATAETKVMLVRRTMLTG